MVLSIKTLYGCIASVDSRTHAFSYPEALADKRFDNTGCRSEAAEIGANLVDVCIVLLQSPTSGEEQKYSALLTVDLTRAVADEAIARKDSIIVSYRKQFHVRPRLMLTPQDPIIFRPLKSLSLSDPQESSLLRLARAGISVRLGRWSGQARAHRTIRYTVRTRQSTLHQEAWAIG